MSYRQLDIVMANCQLPAGPTPHPFLIISSENVRDFEGIYIAVMITSSIQNDVFSYPLNDSDVLNPLPKKSEIRCHLIGTIKSEWITKRVTSLTKGSFDQVINKILQDVIEFSR